MAMNKIEVKAPPTQQQLHEYELREKQRVYLAQFDRAHTEEIRKAQYTDVRLRDSSNSGASASSAKRGPPQPTSNQLKERRWLAYGGYITEDGIKETNVHDAKAPPANLPRSQFSRQIRLVDHVQTDPTKALKHASEAVEHYVQMFQAQAAQMHEQLMPIIWKALVEGQRTAPAINRTRQMLSLTDDLTDNLNGWLEGKAKEFEEGTRSNSLRIEDGAVIQLTTDELWKEWSDTMLKPFAQRWLDGTDTLNSADAQQDHGLNIQV